MKRPAKLPKVAAFAKKIGAGDRRALAKAITFAESALPRHRAFSARLLDRVLPSTGNAIRIGVTGVPGVGKSTFIQTLGLYLVGRGRRVGVLAVDPSSLVTGGSILGDKTRMGGLTASPSAFIRPSPSGGKLGGVAFHTREAILLLEAAGFEAILVETVGAGQSESEVAEMVDIVILLLLPGAGDELQAIKKGVREFADILVVHKADGENRDRAARAVRDLKAAARIGGHGGEWTPPVLMVSSLTQEGLDPVWEGAVAFEKISKKSNTWEKKRKRQLGLWLDSLLKEQVVEVFRAHRAVKKCLKALEGEVFAGRISPATAARKVLAAFLAG